MIQPGQTVRRGREFTGPTPHSVAVRSAPLPVRPVEKIPLAKPQDAAQNQVKAAARQHQACALKNSWLESTERRYLRRAVERQARDAVGLQWALTEERRERLRDLLETEEEQLLEEVAAKVETPVERQAQMREKAKLLREKREAERLQVVAKKQERLFRERCDELRSVASQRHQQQVWRELSTQLADNEEHQRQQKEEDRLFHQLWVADSQAKEDREKERLKLRRQMDVEQMEYLKKQMDATEEARRQRVRLREEEAELLRQQKEAQALYEQRQQRLRLEAKQARRRQLDHSLRLKMKRVAREQQEELRLDMSILQQSLAEETDQRKDAAQKKAALRADQLRYRQYLANEMQLQYWEEAETERLMEEKMMEMWDKRDEKNRRQQEARERLMEEVMEARRLQIQRKLDLNQQKQAEVSKEREQLNAFREEKKMEDKEMKRRRQEARETYQAELQAQVEEQQQLRLEKEAEEKREEQRGLELQTLYQQKIEELMARPQDGLVHPFRRAGATITSEPV